MISLQLQPQSVAFSIRQCNTGIKNGNRSGWHDTAIGKRKQDGKDEDDHLFRKDYLELNNEQKNLLINTIVGCTVKTGDNKTVQKYKALYRTIKSKDKKSKNEKEEERDE